MVMSSTCAGQWKPKKYQELNKSKVWQLAACTKWCYHASNCKGIDETNIYNNIASLMAPMWEFLHYDGQDSETLTTTEKREPSKSKKNKDDQMKKCQKKPPFNIKWRFKIVGGYISLEWAQSF